MHYTVDFISVMGNLWLVNFYGLILHPMARTSHKFPVTENGRNKIHS